jgi:hypothetical protein
MSNLSGSILCEDPLQAAKQREIVKYGLCTKGYDHATRIITSRDGIYYNSRSKTTSTVRNKIDIKEE